MSFDLSLSTKVIRIPFAVGTRRRRTTYVRRTQPLFRRAGARHGRRTRYCANSVEYVPSVGFLIIQILQKCHFGLGSAQEPAGELMTLPQTPLVGWEGASPPHSPPLLASRLGAFDTERAYTSEDTEDKVQSVNSDVSSANLGLLRVRRGCG